MSSQLDFTLKFIESHGLTAILLAEKQKRPVPGQFQATQDLKRIEKHVKAKGNIGILARGVTILDFDNILLSNEMFMQLGMPEPTVITGSGKLHCYVRTDRDLPPSIKWKDQKVGEIQRGENQYVVAPPSIHPNGKPYIWQIGTPDSPLLELPATWDEFLLRVMTPEVPEFLKKYIEQVVEEPWDGPPADVLLAAARRQPGAVARTYGIKFQCPECKAEGHDKHKDNAFVANDGRWGCAYAPGDSAHRKAIGDVLILGDVANRLVSDTDVESIRRKLKL
jgi:hypothetical protein